MEKVFKKNILILWMLENLFFQVFEKKQSV